MMFFNHNYPNAVDIILLPPFTKESKRLVEQLG
jgi:hypothetical protein